MTMIEILPESETDTLALRISGELTREDHAKLEPELRLRAEREGSYDMVVEMADLEGLEMEAIRNELDLVGEHAGSIDRLALVSEDAWWRRLTEFVGTPLAELVGVETRHFDDRVGAWKWLSNEGS